MRKNKVVERWKELQRQKREAEETPAVEEASFTGAYVAPMDTGAAISMPRNRGRRSLKAWFTGAGMAAAMLAAGDLRAAEPPKPSPPAPRFAACMPDAEMARKLKSRYDEEPVAVGLQSNGTLMQVYASEKGQTWTVTVMWPNGRSCIVAVGKSWEHRPLPVKGKSA